MQRPLVPIAIAFALGCHAGGDLIVRVGWVLAGLATILLAAAWTRPAGGWARSAVLGAACALGAAAAAGARGEHGASRLPDFASRASGLPVHVRGRAAFDGAIAEQRLRLVVDVETIAHDGGVHALSGRARIDVLGAGPFPDVVAGDRVAVWAALRLPDGFHNPGAFDVQAHAVRTGVHVHGSCKSVRLLALAPPERRGIRRVVAEARARARQALERHVPPGSERALVRAMLLGDRTQLDARTEERFRAAGTYHVLALSGAQVALLALCVWTVVRRVGLGPRSAAVVMCTCVGAYAGFVGGDVPIVRAAGMAMVLACGRALELDADLQNLLGLAALGLLAHRPGAVHDVGFQLSFVATWAVVAVTPALSRGWPRLPLRAELGVASSLAAQAGLLPLLVLHFQRLAPAALVLNLAAVPLSTAVLACGALVLPAAWLAPGAGDLAGELAWLAAHGLRRSADVMDLVPWLDVRVGPPAWWAVALYAAGLLAWLSGAAGRRATAALLVGLCGLTGGAPRRADGRLHVTALDVGQGDALVLSSPGGRTLLVDAGGGLGGFDVGEAVVAPYLWSQGVTRLDAIAISHAHPDHVGGLPFLLRAFRVTEVWEGPAAHRDRAYAVLDRALREAGVGRRALAAGARLVWDDVGVEVVGPAAGPAPDRVRNDDSLVLAVRHGAFTTLLTGDVERRGERALAVRADVIKVPHHGSRTSSSPEFVAAVGARVALVSAGRRNWFGHPDTAVVARYQRYGALVLRTDRDGALTVCSDGRAIWARTQRTGRERRLR